MRSLTSQLFRPRRFGRTILFAATICFLCLHLSGCYLLKQGYQLLAFQTRAKRVTRILERTADSSLHSFLVLSQSIKRYAEDSLGLSADRNYTTYAEIDRNYSVDVVTAVRDDRFESRKWCYPLVGCVPYKGFFNTDDADRLAGRLRKENYDVHQWRAGAFSTLGILTDPLLSSMREYSVFDLASLILHEQTHATVYLKNQTQFNEELATFVGNEGALRFIASGLGDTAAEYRSAVRQLQFHALFQDWVRDLYAALDSLYRSDRSREEKLLAKKETIAEHRRRFMEANGHRLTPQRRRAFDAADINNAYLTARNTYSGNMDLYLRVYERNGRDLKRTVADLAAARFSRLPPMQYVRRELLGESM